MKYFLIFTKEINFAHPRTFYVGGKFTWLEIHELRDRKNIVWVRLHYNLIKDN